MVIPFDPDSPMTCPACRGSKFCPLDGRSRCSRCYGHGVVAPPQRRFYHDDGDSIAMHELSAAEAEDFEAYISGESREFWG